LPGAAATGRTASTAAIALAVLLAVLAFAELVSLEG
jgi:hypothetical protein